MSVKGTENIEKYQNYYIGTEYIYVYSRTEQTNICVTKICLYEARSSTSF